MSHITACLALGAIALTVGGCVSHSSATAATVREVDGGSSEAVEGKTAVVPTFALGNARWSIGLPGVAATACGEGAVMLVDDGRTFWVARYDEGAGPIDLNNAQQEANSLSP